MRTTTALIYAGMSGLIIGIIIGLKLQSKPTIELPKCPDLIHECPPNIEVNTLDLTDIRKIKGGFVFSPTYNGDVIMKCDTVK